MTSTRPLRRRAFSILEVLISSTMLIIGISGIVMGAQFATRQHEHDRKVGTAITIAERRMEELLLLFPTSLLLTDGRHPEDGFERFGADGARGGDGSFRLFYVVTPATPGGAPPEQRIPGLILEVSIAWDEAVGERSIQLRTVR